MRILSSGDISRAPPAIASAKAAASKGCRSSICLADADRMNGKFEALGDRDENAAARRSVELGHDDAGDPGDLGEGLGLRNGILAGRRIEHQQNGMRGGRILLLQHADDLVEFGHQVRLVLKPAGRVDEENVGCPPGGRFGQASKASPAASAPGAPRNHLARRCARPTPSTARSPRRGTCRRRRASPSIPRARRSRRACRWSSSCRSR